MGNIRYEDITPTREEIDYMGENHVYENFRPLATDSTWQELIDYVTLLRNHYARSEVEIVAISQDLIDRYDADERTDELKESMRTTW